MSSPRVTRRRKRTSVRSVMRLSFGERARVQRLEYRQRRFPHERRQGRGDHRCLAVRLALRERVRKALAARAYRLRNRGLPERGNRAIDIVPSATAIVSDREVAQERLRNEALEKRAVPA